MLTPWGYEVDLSGASASTTTVEPVTAGLPPLISVADFQAITNGKWTNPLAVSTALTAASQAIRNACGWHVSPPLPCTARLTGEGKLLRLPANCVTDVASVEEDGTSLAEGEYEWRRDGMVRRACFKNWSNRYDGVEVGYTAGYEAEAVPDLAQAVLGVAEGVLSLPAGVAMESADGVSITYQAAASSVANANAMTSQFTAQLMPYRLVSAHGA